MMQARCDCSHCDRDGGRIFQKYSALLKRNPYKYPSVFKRVQYWGGENSSHLSDTEIEIGQLTDNIRFFNKPTLMEQADAKSIYLSTNKILYQSPVASIPQWGYLRVTAGNALFKQEIGRERRRNQYVIYRRKLQAQQTHPRPSRYRFVRGPPTQTPQKPALQWYLLGAEICATAFMAIVVFFPKINLPAFRKHKHIATRLHNSRLSLLVLLLRCGSANNL